jgi:hypothetical protein
VRNRSVPYLARKFNCFFAHNYVDPFDVGNGLAWVIRLRGVVSCSTLRPDTNDDTIGIKSVGIARFGIFLKDGNVLSGMPHDMETSYAGLKVRLSPYDNIAGSIESIEEAINKPYGNPLVDEPIVLLGDNYNELVIENPIAAGFYYLAPFNRLPKPDSTGQIRFKELSLGGIIINDPGFIFHFWRKAHDLHLPIFLLDPSNRVRRVNDIDFPDMSFKIGPEMTPVEMVEPAWPWSLVEDE